MNRFFVSRLLSWQLFAASMVLAGGCASRIEAPIIEPPSGSAAAATAVRLDATLPTDVLLLGEQHDAAEHQQIEQQVVARLAAKGLLAALALEMADAGSSTAALQPRATEQQTRNALNWQDEGWPWKVYGPVVMTAVRAGIPVLGANLPRAQMQTAMADSQIDGQLPGPALKAQQQLIRIGHCNLLPESQITPMTRIQIAKDITMATTLSQAALPGKVVVLVTGSAHADRLLGVPQHLPTQLKVKVIRLRAGAADESEKSEAFDTEWATSALPDNDYCAGLRQQFSPLPKSELLPKP